MINKYSKKFVSLASVITNHCQRQANRSITRISFKQSVIVISILITGFVLGVRQLGWLEFLELVAFDEMVSLKGDDGPDPRLLLVTITEADIQNQRQWPFPDQTIALLLEKLQQSHPKAIGLDIYRNLAQPPGHEALQQQLQANNIITINNLGDTGSEGVPKIPGIPPERIGFNDFLIDKDDVVRRYLIYAYQGKNQFYAFSLQLSRKYLEEKGIFLKVNPHSLQLGQTKFPVLSPHTGGYPDLDALGYQVMINYRSPKQIAREISLTQVLKGNFNPAWVKDKIVLIGTTAPSHKDLFFTPYSAAKSANPGMSGIAVHAQLVSQLLSTTLERKPLFWVWSIGEEALWIWAWSLIGGILVWKLRHPLLLGLLDALYLLGLFGVSFVIFTHAGWVPLVPPAIALILTGGTVLAYKLLHNTLHDSLTGLPNRDFFLQQLEWAIASLKLRPNSRFAVLFLDFDRFKIINESLNHQAGDQLLISATQRIKACLRGKGSIARVGGDDFAILLENLADIHDVNQITDQLQREMAKPFNHHGQEIFTSISIGIAFNQTGCDYEPMTLLRDAHTAMYRAKDLGKGRHEVFATGMHTQALKRFQLETDLRRALEKEEFYLCYQPIVSLATEMIIGFEALVRWQHPVHGFISPGEFIPVAEETELIIPLGKWILQEACKQVSIWHNQFQSFPPLMMSINLSGQQLNQRDLVESIEEILRVVGVEGKHLKLEITESIAMTDVEAAISILLKLRTLNLRLSIDDFGTGYSSLSYLHRFPVNTLKIDQSFVSRMEDTTENAAIVETIIMLSHALGMDVIAEGIETSSQKAKLKTLGCEYGQGYFFAKPLDKNKATTLLEGQVNSAITWG